MLLFLQPCFEVGKFGFEFRGDGVADLGVETFDVFNVVEPRRTVDLKQILYRVGRDAVKSLYVDVLGVRNVTYRRAYRADLILATLDYPEQNSEVVAVTRPDEVALVVGSEPVDVENLRRIRYDFAHIEPMFEIFAHIVTDERTHRHRIAADYADGSRRGGGRLRRHYRADESAVLPAR